MHHHAADPMRRALLAAGLAAPLSAPLSTPRAATNHRILVVFEMSGGNDGLNTVVPYADDVYHRLRPRLAIRPERVRKIDEHFGLNPGMAGFERLYKDGRLAIVHGCGYDQPSFSHFASMAYWQTAAPNSGEQTGWVGRLADVLQPGTESGVVVNIAPSQSLAVRARRQVPVVFDDPERFVRRAPFEAQGLIDRHTAPPATDPNATRRYLHEIAASARESSARIRDACASYRTPVDYGLVTLDLPKVAALIAAGLPTRLYYVAYRNNAFDTHVQQADTHQRLLTYVSDAVAGFLRDMERIGRADDVVLMAFSEFGRRVAENANLGTDHGTAGPMFIAGKPVRGGQYGETTSLAGRSADDNLVHTTDFRRVYATLTNGWLGLRDSQDVLNGQQGDDHARPQHRVPLRPGQDQAQRRSGGRPVLPLPRLPAHLRRGLRPLLDLSARRRPGVRRQDLQLGAEGQPAHALCPLRHLPLRRPGRHGRARHQRLPAAARCLQTAAAHHVQGRTGAGEGQPAALRRLSGQLWRQRREGRLVAERPLSHLLTP
jgi:uncharacterized protein (DUF1501 family)